MTDETQVPENTPAWANRQGLDNLARLNHSIEEARRRIHNVRSLEVAHRYISEASRNLYPTMVTDAVNNELLSLGNLLDAALVVTDAIETLLRAEATPEALAKGAVIWVLWREKYTLVPQNPNAVYYWQRYNKRVGTGEWVEVGRHRDPKLLDEKVTRRATFMILPEGVHPTDEGAESQQYLRVW